MRASEKLQEFVTMIVGLVADEDMKLRQVEQSRLGSRVGLSHCYKYSNKVFNEMTEMRN